MPPPKDQRGLATHKRAGSGIVPYASSPQRTLLSSPSSPSAPTQKAPKWVVQILIADEVQNFGIGTESDGVGAGFLMPLHPTLSAQTAGIVRHFSWPSGTGVCLHVGPNGPRLTDEAWAHLFGWALPGSPSDSGVGAYGRSLGFVEEMGLPIAARLEVRLDLSNARWVAYHHASSTDSSVSISDLLTAPVPQDPLLDRFRQEGSDGESKKVQPFRFGARGPLKRLQTEEKASAKTLARGDARTDKAQPGRPRPEKSSGVKYIPPIPTPPIQQSVEPAPRPRSSDSSWLLAFQAHRLKSLPAPPSTSAPIAAATVLPPSPDLSWVSAFQSHRAEASFSAFAIPTALRAASEPPSEPESDLSSRSSYPGASSPETLAGVVGFDGEISFGEGDEKVVLEAAPPPPVLCVARGSKDLKDTLISLILRTQAEARGEARPTFTLAICSSLLDTLEEALERESEVKWALWDVVVVDTAVPSTLTDFALPLLPRASLHCPRATPTALNEAKSTSYGLDALCDDLAHGFEQVLLEVFEGDKPAFDLVLLDIGSDGRVGTLLPDHHLLGEHDWSVGWLADHPDEPSHRITLTLPVLNSARQAVFVVTGSEKAQVLADALERTVQSDVPMDEDRDLPAALVKSSGRPIVWLVDEAAASQTDYEVTDASELLVWQAR